MSAHKKNTPVSKTGLGRFFLLRSGIIFLSVIVVLVSLISAGVYLGIKNGKLEKNLIKPIQEFAKLFNGSFSTDFEYETDIDNLYGDINAENPPADNVRQTPVPTTKSLPQKPSNTQNNSYQDAQKAQDEWFKKAQEENQKTSQQWQAEYDQFVKDSNQRYEDFKNTSEQNYQNFKSN